MSKLYLFPQTQPDRIQMLHYNGVRIEGHPDTHPSGRNGWSIDLPATLPNGHGALITTTKEGYYPVENRGRVFLGGTSFTLEEWDGLFAYDDYPMIKISDAPPIPPEPPNGHAGCVNGLLLKPFDWFFDHIDRQLGQKANDWREVMIKSGLGQGPAPDEIIPDPDPQGTYGIRQQIGAGGPRGRLFLPSSTPSIHIVPETGKVERFYTEEWQLIADDPNVPGGLIWALTRMTNTTYRPFKC